MSTAPTLGPCVPGAAETALGIRRGTIGAEEHVTQVLWAIEQTQRDLGAWAHVDHRGALDAARRADAIRSRGDRLGPLHGVAIGVKDVLPVAGMPMRAGSRTLPGTPDTHDAAAVARLRAAGAIVVGKTTTHELASGQGDPGTRGARHPDRHPGGSSVGSAVAVAGGTVGATLGTDTTGSIRNPAAAQGVVGFKPSNGAVPTAGLLHFSHTLDVIGPIGTSVADCRVLFEALSGAAPSPRSGRAPVLVLPTPLPDADPAFRASLDRALGALDDAGIVLVEHATPSYAMAMAAALVISLVEGVAHHAERLRTCGADYLPETRRLVAAGCLLESADEAAARRAAVRVRAELVAIRRATGADAVVGLTLPGPQPLLAEAESSLTAPPDQGAMSAGIQHLSTANLTGAPAITIPLPAAGGHPVGLHLLGLEGDAPLLAVAETVERALR